MPIFDTHAHYDDHAFDEDRHTLLANFPQNGVCGVINAAVDLASCETSLALAHAFPFVYAAVGVHPSELDKYTDADLQPTMARLSRLYADEKAVAIGEIGLDYHYDTVPRDVQKRWFARQVELAVALDAPVIVHDREAHEDTLCILRQFKPKGVVHCFSGSVETMKEVVSLGMYIGLGGATTFKNAVKPPEVAKAVPADRLLLETDAPYMAPVPHRGKRCDSTMIAYSAAVIAEVRGITVAELLLQTEQNAKAAFPKIR